MTLIVAVYDDLIGVALLGMPQHFSTPNPLPIQRLAIKLMDSSRSVVQVSTEVVVTRKWMWQVDIATTRAMGENVSDLKPTVRGYCLSRTARL